MNKNQLNIFVTLALTFLLSCSNEADNNAVMDDSAPVEITASIGQDTRAYNNQWESGDVIGIYVFDNGTSTIHKTYENYPYETTTELGNFSVAGGKSAILMPSDGSKLDFLAYWPYQADLTVNTFSISSWAEQNNQKSMDLLLSDKVTERNATNKTVSLTFTHQFSKIILNIFANSDESQLMKGDLTGMTVSADGMNVATNVNVLTGVMTHGSVVNTPIAFVTDESSASADVQATAILAPGYNTNTENRKVKFLLANGKLFTWTIPSAMEFQKGNCYTWSIKLKGEGLVEADLTATITDWTNNDGGEINLDFN